VIARRILLGVAAALLAGGVSAAPEPLPAAPPMTGVVWSIVVPAILFVLAFGATYLLYRHFARGQE
jgi:hypothetical protein